VKAHADLRQFDDAWRCIDEAIRMIERTKERWWEAEVNRIAGEIALLSPERDTAKAETYFERALSVARQQQAKSWELRAAMSLARLWPRSGEAFQWRLLGGHFVKVIRLGIELRCEPLDIFARDNFFLALKTHANSKIVEPFDHRLSPSWIATLL
jgi:hypothetical protein